MRWFRVSVITFMVAAFALVMLGCRDDNPATVINTLTPGVLTTTVPEGTRTAGPAATQPGGSGTANPTATTQPGADCPLPAPACTVARQIESQLATRNVAAIADMNLTQSFTCPGTLPQGSGGPFPLCAGAPAGDSRAGYQTGRRYSEGAVLSRPAYEQFLTGMLQQVNAGATDASGAGALRLYTVGCVEPAANPQACVHFTVTFSAIFGDHRELLVFFVRPAASAAQITGTWNGIVMADEAAILFGTPGGGTLFDLGRVFQVGT